jgi:orotidine-5'-phosphate decarboxylase
MNKKIIVALDNNNIKNILNTINDLKEEAFAFKVGYEFFYNFGHEGYSLIDKKKIKIFLDLKLHDIPNTVKKGIEAISKLNPYFLTIHISGGDQMHKAANLSKKNTKILGVSILTSLDSQQIKKYYFSNSIEKIVSDYTNYALKSNLDGIVCSPLEVNMVKKIAGNKLITVVPGIRPREYNNKNDDQKRYVTPKEAIDFGADYLVIGRPITESHNPLKSIKEINESLV